MKASEAARDMFGEMRPSTEKEAKLCSDMLKRNSVSMSIYTWDNFEKLAEVARDMFDYIGCNCREQLCAGCKMLVVGEECDAVRLFREKLEDCGVTFDD